MLPRVVWMVPGQTLFVGGIIRIDLLEVAEFEFALAINNFYLLFLEY